MTICGWQPKCSFALPLSFDYNQEDPNRPVAENLQDSPLRLLQEQEIL